MASSNFQKGFKRTALAVALGVCFAGAVHAQSSVGSINGQASANQSVTVTNVETGATRTVTAGSDGRFSFSQLAPGRYKVDSGSNSRTVAVNVGAGTQVDFAAASGTLDAVNVSADNYNANAIDVSSVASNTVFTAEQIEQIPVGRSVQSVALLAPSVVANSSYASNAPSFGGSASSENAYYINGYAVTNPLTSIGFSTLPFDGVGQMEVLTGGYGAQYGRSTGGVIAVTTKRGTNDWHFGGAVFYTPKGLRSDYKDYYYPNTGFYGAGQTTQPTDGKLYQIRHDNTLDTKQYGLYASGPIIKDHLFFYASGDFTESKSEAVRSAIPSALYNTVPTTVPAVLNGYGDTTQKSPRWLAKLDWQINDNHSIELTGIQDRTDSNYIYSSYDYKTGVAGTTQTGGGTYRDGGKLYIGRYIGHFTDNLSLSVLYGTQKIDHTQNLFGYNPACPRISGVGSNLKPGLTIYQGCQTQSSVAAPGTFEETKGGRIDLDWTLGAHTIRFGYDATQANTNSGTQYAGGYVWSYLVQNDSNEPVDAAHGVVAPGATSVGTDGKSYYASKTIFTNSANVKTEQKAYYIEDRWQVTDNFLLSLGVRNENFTNYNGDGRVYVEQKNQWAPRLGFSWDVNGDSSLKLFGNVGRYHLALPNNVAARAAASSLYTTEYFNYTGIDATTGAPTGTTPIVAGVATDGTDYRCSGNAVSSNLECGNAADPRTVAAIDLKPHYQDEAILGFQHQLSENINWGLKYHYRTLGSAIDDTCTPVLSGACFIFNPGVDNTFYEDDGNGNMIKHTYTAAQLNFPKLKRKYWALDAYVEHSLANNWFGRLEYSFSRNYGNTEGQLASDLDTGAGGQTDVSVTQDWDLPTLMEGAYGLLPNHRAHQIKAYGFYKFSPEFRVGASAIITSGRPLSCTSYYPDANAPQYRGAYYHWCGIPGTASYVYTPRGTSGSTPWTHQLNLNAEYRPNWAGSKLAFQVDVLNVMNEQNPGYKYTRYASSRTTPSRFYGQDLSYDSPRSVRFTVRYDY